MVSSGVVAAIHVAGCVVALVVQFVATHCTTRATTHTCYMYCCHNAGADHRDFKFSVLKILKNSYIFK